MAWPGLVKRTMPHQLWPSLFVRRVNHVKLVQDAQGALTGKVYLCAEHMAAARSPQRAPEAIEEAVYPVE